MKVQNPSIYDWYGWTSASPGLILILVDQSDSMRLNYSDGFSRIEFACSLVNKVIDNIIQRSFDGEAPKNRCFVSVIGYNTNVTELCSGWLKDLAEKPLRYEKMQQKIPDGTGGILTIDVENPVWIEATDIQGVTNMKGAFEQARSLVKKWMQDYPDNPAPVIVNLTANALKSNDERCAIVDSVEELKTMICSNCFSPKVRLINIGIGCKSEKTVLPNSIDEISNPNDRVLYNISSEVDHDSKTIYKECDLMTDVSSKFLIVNGSLKEIFQIITKMSGLTRVYAVPINPYKNNSDYSKT